MLHHARHRAMPEGKLVVKILRMMVSFCVIQIVAGMYPALLSAGSLKASWNANTEPDLAGYKIYYGRSSGNYTVSINVGKVTQYTVTQLAEGVIFYFVVTAYDAAGNESAYSQEVSAQVSVVDRTPPSINSVKPLNLSTIEIKFSEAVSAASAQNKANYVIDNGITISSATLLADNVTAILATSAHAVGKTYKITIQKIADRAATPNLMPQPASFTYSFRAVDEVPPAVSNVRIVNPTLVEVLFSEPVTVASAQNTNNYAIDNGIAIASAVLLSDTRTIKLATSEHAAGKTYSIVVRNIADRATPANVMPQARTFTYTLQVEDLQAPEVNSVTMTDLTHLLIVFNEPVIRATAENVDNYSISDGIEVQQASLASNGLEVMLFTTPHIHNKDYNVTIVHIKDRSPAGNTIAAGTFTYFLANQPDDNPNNLGVESLSPARYDFASLEVGQAYYIDRPYVVMQAPASKRGMLLIKTANVDRGNNAENFLSFTLTREMNVYVGYDSRATQPPNWLRDYFTRTNETIVVSESAGRLNLWKMRGMSGRMTLGGNMAPGVQTNTSLSMYIVLIEDMQASGPDSQTPQTFVLRQNYPNPFSLTGGSMPGQTRIEYYLQEQHQVELKVHNTLGQVVRTLHRGSVSPGNYTLTWDGRDDRGELVPTGKYLCTLEVRDEMTNGEFTMSASLNRQTKVITLVK